MRIRIAKKIYNVKTSWEHITLSDAIEIARLRIPEGLRRMLLGEEVEAKPEEFGREWPEYYGKVIAILSDIPGEIIDRISPVERAALWEAHIAVIVGSIVLGYDLKNEKREYLRELKIDDKVYKMPGMRKIGSVEVPFYDVKVRQFGEIADLYVAACKVEDGGWEHVPLLIAVTVREEGKEYNEEVALELAKKCKELPMRVVWDFFHYWQGAFLGSLHYILTSIAEATGRGHLTRFLTLCTRFLRTAWQELGKIVTSLKSMSS